MIKRLKKYFIFVFLFTFVVANWGDISPFFNYNFIKGRIDGIFIGIEEGINKRKTAIGDFFRGFIILETGDAKELKATLEIPKIGVLAPIIFSKSSNEKILEVDLKNGVVHFPSSAMPGQEGVMIILGHSAPKNWPKVDYDWVFSNLEKLNKGDTFFIELDGYKYSYQVTEKIFLDRGEEIPKINSDSSPTVFLISCWPPGKNLKRIGIQAELIN